MERVRQKQKLGMKITPTHHMEMMTKMKTYPKHDRSKLAYHGSASSIICVIFLIFLGGCLMWPRMQINFSGLGENEIGHFLRKEFPLYLTTMQELKEKILLRTHGKGKTTKTDLQNALEEMGMRCDIIRDICIYSGSVRGVRFTPGKEDQPWQSQYIISMNLKEGLSSMTFDEIEIKLLIPEK